MKVDSSKLLEKKDVIHGPKKSCNQKENLGNDDNWRVNDDGDETWKFLDLSIRKLPKDRMRAYLAAKKLVNMGELSKAISQFKALGPAPMSPMVRKEINRKFVKSTEQVTWPTDDRIRERRKSGRETIKDSGLRDVIPEPKEHIPSKEDWWKQCFFFSP